MQTIKGVIKISNITEGIVIASLIKEIYSKLNNSIREEFEILGFTVPQVLVISMLSRNGELKISDISDGMHITKGTVSGIIDRLENQKIVSKNRSQEDRRVVYVKLTDEGDNISKEFPNIIDSYFNNMFSDSTFEELKSIKDGLKLLKKIVDRKVAE